MKKGAKAGLILVAVVAVGIGGCFYLVEQPERSMAAKLPALKERGEPFNIPYEPEDMERFSPDIAPDESGTEALVAFGTAHIEHLSELRNLEPLEQANAVHQTVANERELSANLQTLLNARGFPFNREWKLGFRVQFPEYAPAKSTVRTLSTLALHEAAQGNENAAAERFNQALWVGRETTYEPILIAGLVRSGVVSITVRDAHRAALLLEEPEASANLLRKVAAEIPTDKSFNHYLTGELYQISSLRYLEDRDLLGAMTGDDSFRGVPMHLVFDANNPTHVDALLARALEDLLPAMEAYEQDPLQGHTQLKELDQKYGDEPAFDDLIDGSRVMARVMFPIYSRAVPAMHKAHTERDLLLVMAEAIERTGQLVPPELPAEARALTETELAYEPRPGGYAIAGDILGDGLQIDLAGFEEGDDRPETDTVVVATVE
jgi:hypothetical protein